MYSERKCVPQNIELPSRLRTASTSKLNPKKKPKDSQNSKSLESFESNCPDLSDLFTESLTKAFSAKLSSLSSEEFLKSPKVKSKDRDKVTPTADAEPINSSSAKKEGKSERADGDEQKTQSGHLKELPSQMWWVPPLKEPSIYRSPSVTMSAKSYSLISSIFRPRGIHSANDLRKKVISECKRLEAKSCEGRIENTEEGEGEAEAEGEGEEGVKVKPQAEVEGASLNEFAVTPPPSLTNSTPTESTMTITLKTACPRNAVGKAPSVSEIFDFQGECGNDFSRFDTELDFRVSENSFPSKAVRNMESQTSCHSQGRHYENMECREAVRYASIGEMAHKHIINPMAAQLARLCMKQGQLYMNVLEDLEKSCEEFQIACANKSLD